MDSRMSIILIDQFETKVTKGYNQLIHNAWRNFYKPITFFLLNHKARQSCFSVLCQILYHNYEGNQ